MRAWLTSIGRLCLVAALVAVASGAGAATTLYKWVDENGVTHYSDRPEPGAEKVRIAAAQTYQGSTTSASQSRPLPPAKAAVDQSYTRLEITNPENGAVLYNTGGRVEVGAALEPDLANGHQLWFLVDGKPTPGSPNGTATLEVARGEHTLAAQVTKADGEEMITSAPITFFVHQTSVAQPPQGPALPKPKTTKP